jgi:hypothetical protein
MQVIYPDTSCVLAGNARLSPSYYLNIAAIFSSMSVNFGKFYNSD